MPAEKSGRPATSEELTSTMLGLDLWVMIATATDAVDQDPSTFAQHLPAHLLRMIELEEQGVLFASGPLLDDDGNSGGDGLSIVRASSREEAEAIADGDPLVQAGLRTVKIQRWRIMEGGISVGLSFASGGFELS